MDIEFIGAAHKRPRQPTIADNPAAGRNAGSAARREQPLEQLRTPCMQCKAKSKRSGERCKNNAMIGQEVCRLHGGKSLKGIAAPNYQGKGFSKYMPVGLLDTYQEFASAPDKLILDEQIAIVDTYMAQLLESLGDYSSPELWEQLQTQVIEYKKAKSEDKAALLDYIFEQIDAGASYVSKWDTLHKALEQRRKLVSDARKQRIEAEQMIEADKALLIVTGLLESVRRNVNDRDTLTAIQADFISLVSANSQRRLDRSAAD